MAATHTTEDVRQRLLAVAEAVAPGWERRREFVEGVAAPVRGWIVRELEAGPGDTVLELAAGAGDTGFEVAAAIGEAGRLISTDFSPTMLGAARRRAGELGVANVDFRVMDAQRIELDDDSVDGVICRFGYMLMADPAAALAETRRVLRPDGRLALAVWGRPQRNPFFAIIGAWLVERGHLDPPDPARPGPFRLSDEDGLRDLLTDAGLTPTRFEEVPVRFAFRDVAEYVSLTADTAGPLAVVLQRLPEAELRALEAALDEACAPFATGDGYELPGVALLVAAR
jgi:ubiquinone/menaquinone biosynthesis C-methylase UbiE